MKPSLVLATNNGHKLGEFRAMLSDYVHVLSLEDIGCSINPEETGATFSENALIKARAVSAYSDLPVLADDSGLSVDALGGEPGVHSARFAGPGATDKDNLNLLLQRMSGIPERRARFVAALCLLKPGGEAELFIGECPGTIAEQPSGQGGFGYDPVFIPDGYAQTFAELPSSVKHEISHRAVALNKLRNKIIELSVHH